MHHIDFLYKCVTGNILDIKLLKTLRYVDT